MMMSIRFLDFFHEISGNKPPCGLSGPAGSPARSAPLPPLRKGFRPKKSFLCVLSLALGFLARVPSSAFASDADLFFAGLARSQTNLATWTADFTQTRSLKSLAHPVSSQGRVWYAEPGLFRWELGDPPQTVALRQTNQLVVLYPRLKRAEIYPLDGGDHEPWRAALSLLDAGFPKSRTALETRFRLLALANTNGLWKLTLAPRNTGARRLIAEIQVEFRATDFLLVAHEARFGDGSSLRNEFTNLKPNAVIAPELLNPSLGGEYQVAEPFKGIKR